MRSAIAFASALFVTFSGQLLRAQEPTAQKRIEVQFKGQLASLRVPLEAKAVTAAPYSAEVVNESLQILADGNRIVQRTTGRVYRDGQGRVRREEDHASGVPFVSIIDPAAGISYSLDPESHVAWKTPIRASKAILKIMDAAKREQEQSTLQGADDTRRRRDEQRRKQEAEDRATTLAGAIIEKGSIKEQHSEEVLEARIVEGVQASGHRRTTTIPSGAMGNDLPITIVSEEWVSPDLNVLVMTHRTDPRSGESSYRLLNIIRAEPDPSLFQVPGDYTVRETDIRRFEPGQD